VTTNRKSTVFCLPLYEVDDGLEVRCLDHYSRRNKLATAFFHTAISTKHKGRPSDWQPCVIGDVIGNSSLTSPYFFVYFWISEKVKWFSLIKTYLVHAKSTGELISFDFSDRSVWSLVSAKRSATCWVQTKIRLHFLADLWSQSEFRTQRKSQLKTDPKSERTQCLQVEWTLFS